MAYYTNNDMEIFRGDIFYVHLDTRFHPEQKSGRPAIIVSNDMANKSSPNVNVVYLTSQEKKPLPTHVSIVCKVPSTALCENIYTVPKERLSDFIKSCTTSEMKAIDNALRHSLGLNMTEVAVAEPVPAVEPTSNAEVELNVYKQLYHQLLDKMTGGRTA